MSNLHSLHPSILFTGKLAAILLAVAASTAVADPITDLSTIFVNQFDGGRESSSNAGNSSASSVFSTYASERGNTIQARGNLATGEVGTRVNSAIGESGQSIIALFDTLTFASAGGGPTEVFFDLHYEGTLRKSKTTADAFLQTFVAIYDITDTLATDGTWLQTRSVLGLFDVTEVQDDVGDATARADSLIIRNDEPDETLVVNDTLRGSFFADPSKTYGIQIASNSRSSDNSSSDFLGTSTFGFSNLNGATFTSASGTFLSAASTSVPEPGVLALLLFGLATLCAARRRQLP